MSMKLAPAASAFTTASCGFGAGAGTSSYTSASAPPKAWMRMAFMETVIKAKVKRKKAKVARNKDDRRNRRAHRGGCQYDSRRAPRGRRWIPDERYSPAAPSPVRDQHLALARRAVAARGEADRARE